MGDVQDKLAILGTIDISITKNDFKYMVAIEATMPAPHKVVINGALDELNVSKSNLVLNTEDGLVNVFAHDNSLVLGLVNFLGKEITITGRAHYCTGGQLSFIDIESYHVPEKKDSFFSRKPRAMSAEQQLMFQAQHKAQKHTFTAMLGHWPGDESDEEFVQLLKQVS